MNRHLRFPNRFPRSGLRRSLIAITGLGALVVPVFTSCGTTGDRLLSLSQSVPPDLPKNETLLHVQCYFFTAPDGFQLLENTKGAHIAGIYSPQDGAKLVASLKKRRGFALASAPSVTLRQGKSGRIEVIREFIYPTEYAPPKTTVKPSEFTADRPSSVFPITPSTPTKFESTNLGITAEFSGRTTATGEIGLDLSFERRTFLGFINFGSPIQTTAKTAQGKSVPVFLTENRIEMPIFDTRRIAATVDLTGGHYLALGGLKPTTPNPERIHRAVESAKDADRNLFVLIRVETVPTTDE